MYASVREYWYIITITSPLLIKQIAKDSASFFRAEITQRDGKPILLYFRRSGDERKKRPRGRAGCPWLSCAGCASPPKSQRHAESSVHGSGHVLGDKKVTWNVRGVVFAVEKSADEIGRPGRSLLLRPSFSFLHVGVCVLCTPSPIVTYWYWVRNASE